MVAARRRQHYLSVYRRIGDWFRLLRDGAIQGLSPESQAEAVLALDALLYLDLPDLTAFGLFDWQL